jgi:hypothetical protein
MKLQDHSDLRSTERIEIPLNGRTYFAQADPPGDVIIKMTTMGDDADLQLALRAMNGEELPPDEMLRASKAGMATTRKSLAFLDAVLEPESAIQWRFYMSAPPDDADASALEDHAEHRISLKQTTAVVRDLVGVYGGGRPTSPPPSSSSGRRGGGKTSTAGARRKG